MLAHRVSASFHPLLAAVVSLAFTFMAFILRAASPRASASSASGCWARTNTAATRKETVEGDDGEQHPDEGGFRRHQQHGEDGARGGGETRPALNRVRVKTRSCRRRSPPG